MTKTYHLKPLFLSLLAFVAIAGSVANASEPTGAYQVVDEVLLVNKADTYCDLLLKQYFTKKSIFEFWDSDTSTLTIKVPDNFNGLNDFSVEDNNIYKYNGVAFTSVELYYANVQTQNNNEPCFLVIDTTGLPITLHSKNYYVSNIVITGYINGSGSLQFSNITLNGNISGSGTVQFNNGSNSINGNIHLDGGIDNRGTTNITGNVVAKYIDNYSKLTIDGDVVAGNDNSDSSSSIKSDTSFTGDVTFRILNLEELQDISTLHSIKPIKVTKAIYLPEKVDTKNYNLTVELSDDAEIVVEHNISAKGIEGYDLFRITVEKYKENSRIQAYRTSNNQDIKAIEEFIPKITISEIANERNYSNELLDITEDDLEFDTTIDSNITEENPLNFTLLTTPSKGLSIANGVTISEPVKIRLKL